MDIKTLYNVCENYIKITKNIYMQRPKIVYVMEVDEKLHLYYFKQPQIKAYPLNLNRGFIAYQYSHDEAYKSGLRVIENYIMNNKLCKQINPDKNIGKIKVFTQLAVLYRIMLIPYRLRESLFHDFTISAVKCNGNIYLVQKCNNAAQGDWKSESHHSRLKQYCFTDSLNGEINITTDGNKKTPCVYNTQIENFDISYSANLNGVISDEEIRDGENLDQLNQCRFVFTKCLFKSAKYSWHTHLKTLNFWIQAYLNNIQDIYIALKDRDGCVRTKLEHALTKDLPLKSQGWQPEICIRFLYKYLSNVQEIMADTNCPHTVFEFQYVSSKKSILYKKHVGKTEESFLSDDFVEYLQKK